MAISEESYQIEGDIGVCGIAVLDNFSCGISVILILNCGIAVFSKSAGCSFWHFGREKKLSFKFSNVFRAFSSFRSFHFLLIISQQATGCSLFCLFCPNLNFCFRVICSKLNVQCSGFSMTASFDTVL